MAWMQHKAHIGLLWSFLCLLQGATADDVCEVWKAEVLRRQIAERDESTSDAYDSDALGETKHKPFLRIEGTTAYAAVGLGAVTGVEGDLIHPMTDSEDSNTVHWIDTIWVEDQSGRVIGMRRISPLEPPPATLSFPIPYGTTMMTVYEHCNKHGLWKGQSVAVDPVQTVTSPLPTCDLAVCDSLATNASVCPAHVAEYWRLYEKEFERSDAVDGNTNLKHKPSLTVHGDGSATVTVGAENVGADGTSITFHPMSPSDDKDVVHWINSIWVSDQTGKVVAMRDFLPTDPGPASFTFEVPAGATKLTAYEYCNKHGLFEGDEVTLTSGDTSPSQLGPTCSVKECEDDPPRIAREVDCLAFVADAKRRQVDFNTRSPDVYGLPYTLGADNEKHSPYVVLDGTVAKAVVGRGAATGDPGDPIHPMSDDSSNFGENLHYIEAIWVEDQDGEILAFRQLSPSEPSPATMLFDIPVGTTSITAYELCNKHGLFQGPSVAVTAANTKIGARAGCSVQQCVEGTVISTCSDFTSEFWRRQEGAPAKTDSARKHEPFIMINGSTATIVVGEGAASADGSGLIHPMSPSDDPNVVHWISHIFALDGADNLVALCELLPTDPAPATCTFEVPQGVQALVPYEFCNKHGLYVGEEVTVGETNQLAPRTCMRRECSEAQPSLLGAEADRVVEPCNAWRAEVFRRQIAERGEATSDAYVSDVLGETKHKPYIRVEGTTAIVVVGLGAVTGVEGDLIHPMTDSTDSNTVHWIDTIWAEDQNGKVIGMRRLSPLEPAPATLAFPIPYGTTMITAYEHCNKHGIYKGQTIVVAPVQSVSSPLPTCDLAACGAAGNASTCPVHVAEYWRVYEKEFERTLAVDGDTNLKHKPSLTLHGNGSATVQVGAENVQTDGTVTFHPMSPSDDPDIVHWINSIWVTDQTGALVAMRDFLPTDPGPATFTFEIPTGTTKLRAYEYCNKHGLFEGDEITLSSSDASSSQTAMSCNVRECSEDPVRYAREVDCLAFVADAKRRQVDFNTLSPDVYGLPYTLGADNEKHSPYIVLDGLVAKVVVGRGAATGDAADPIHPMTDDPANYGENLHFIEWIWVEDQNGDILSFRSLSPSEASPATMYFDIPVGTTSLTAYEFCNKHGLFQGPTVSVTAANTRIGARTGCSVQQCVEGTGVTTCQAYTSEFWRRLGQATAKSDPARKHEPFLLLNGSTATIVVGEGAATADGSGLIHPMSPSDDPDTVHWISHIFARDDMGNLVALCELLPTDPAPATCTFQVPPGVLFLRPYEFCNKHGLYVGQMVTVTETDGAAQRTCVKRECSEAQPSLSSAALSSAAVDATLDSQAQSLQRISTINMCLEHRATFSIPVSQVEPALLAQIDKLTQLGDAASDTERRREAYSLAIPALKLKGGEWHALPEVIEHVGLDGAGLRFDLIDAEKMRFLQRVLPKGTEEFVDGVEDAITSATEDLLLIQASFQMTWGYPMYKALGNHFTVFYRPDFAEEVVDVALCAKTLGWMGIGWLTPDHVGHYMNYTDMNVVFIKDGQTVVQDRFAFRTEEPVRDESLPNQRRDSSGGWETGQSDLQLIEGSLGTTGKEWCPDAACSPGFTLVQYRRNFSTPDAWDARLPRLGPRIGLIHAFASVDPTELEMVEHIMSTAGYVDLTWNKQCGAGTYFNEDRVACISCDRGTFRPESAPPSKCLQCPKGKYQGVTGQSACESCPSLFTTASIASLDARACACSGPTVENLAGWYHAATCGGGPTTDDEGEPLPCMYLGECKSCPEGTVCPGGFELAAWAKDNATEQQRVTEYCASIVDSGVGACSSRDFCSEFLGDSACQHALPLLKVGFSSLEDDPMNVFLCRDTDACPGGPPGSCGERRDEATVACADCVENSYKSWDVCYECEGGSVLPFVAVIIGGLAMLAVFTVVINNRVFLRAGASTTAGILAGTMFSSFQTLTSFQTMEMNWIDPMKSFMKITALFTLNLEVARVSCMFGSDPVMRYATRILGLPLVAIWTFLVLAVRKLVKKKVKLVVEVCNSLGAMNQLFFIPIVLAVLAPFICYGHPSGQASMMSYPAILCYEDPRHIDLLLLAILGFLLICVPFIAAVIYATATHKKSLSRHDTDEFDKFRFLFIRFAPERYYFGVIFMARGLLICLVPIVTGRDPALQLVVMSTVLSTYMAIQAWNKPWRADPSGLKFMDANVADASLTFGCVLLMITGALTTYYKTSEVTVQAVGMIVLIFFGFVMITGGVTTAKERVRPSPFYHFFIAHHKAKSGSQIKLIKFILSKVKGKKVCTDADQLTDFDLSMLMDAVRVRTETFIVYASGDVLKQPWVAGEVVVAHAKKKRWALIKCPNFEAPTSEELENLGDYMEHSRHVLTNYGISIQVLSTAYTDLLDEEKTQTIDFALEPGRRKFEHIVDYMSGRSFSMIPSHVLKPDALPKLLGTILISSDPLDDEASATASLLEIYLADALKQAHGAPKEICCLVDFDNIRSASYGHPGSEADVDLLSSLTANARAILVLLSKKSLARAAQVTVMLEAMRGVEGTTRLADGPAKLMAKSAGGLQQAVVPILLPSFPDIPTKDADLILPHMWHGSESAKERRGIQDFFKTASTSLDCKEMDIKMHWQMASILERIPPKEVKVVEENGNCLAQLPSGRWHVNV